MQKGSECVVSTLGKGVSNKHLGAVHYGGLLSHLHLGLAQHTRLFALFLNFRKKTKMFLTKSCNIPELQGECAGPPHLCGVVSCSMSFLLEQMLKANQSLPKPNNANAEGLTQKWLSLGIDRFLRLWFCVSVLECRIREQISQSGSLDLET